MVPLIAGPPLTMNMLIDENGSLLLQQSLLRGFTDWTPVLKAVSGCHGTSSVTWRAAGLHFSQLISYLLSIYVIYQRLNVTTFGTQKKD